MLNRRKFVQGSTALGALMLSACKKREETPAPKDDTPSVDTDAFKDLVIDSASWMYDADNDIYWQLGHVYCNSPASSMHESLAIFVPGAYFNGEKKGDYYEVSLNKEKEIAGYTAETAPIVMPINSGRLAAQLCPTSYSADGLAPYMEAGFIYVYAGFRGKSAGFESGSKELIHGGSPWPVVDMKAAIRCIRLNLQAEAIPGSKDRIVSFGFGEGASVVASLAASGDSEAYKPYLDEIEAATIDLSGNNLSDALYGAATWCPSVGFGEMDMAYEWSQGQWQQDEVRVDGSFAKAISKDLTTAYASWVNASGMKTSEGEALTLDATEDASYAQGSYYEGIVGLVEKSAATFCGYTSFPYTTQVQLMSNAPFPGDPNLEDSDVVEAASTSSVEKTGEGEDTEAEDKTDGVSQVQATVYDSLEAYLQTLNKDGRWISYSSARKRARITGLWNVATKLRPSKKAPLSFDAIEKNSDANQLFGIDDESTLHFSNHVADILEQNQDSYKGLSGYSEDLPAAWAEDMAKKDALDTVQDMRVHLMDPLYFLLESSEAYGTSTVAPCWRIQEGLLNEETPIASYANLHFALAAHKSVSELTSRLVFDAPYCLAEEGGSGAAQKNFISWVAGICPGKDQDNS